MDIVETVRTELRAAADTFSIGKSERGNDILCAHCGGHGGRQIIITAGIHARECYTAFVALRQIRDYNSRGDDGAYIIPLVNPDGARFLRAATRRVAKFSERMQASIASGKPMRTESISTATSTRTGAWARSTSGTSARPTI